MATDAQSLLTAAECYQCYGASGYMLTLMKLGLLQQFVRAVNPMADTSPQALLSQAQCYDCNGGSLYSLQLMELALLAQIAAGGTAKVCILGGVGPPAIVVPCDFSAYIQTPGPNFGLWLGDLGTGWAEVITQGP